MRINRAGGKYIIISMYGNKVKQVKLSCDLGRIKTVVSKCYNKPE